MTTSEISSLSTGRVPTSTPGGHKGPPGRPEASGSAQVGAGANPSPDVERGGSALAADEVGRLNQLIQQFRRELRFSVDQSTGETIIRVINAQTKELVRQIPPDEVVSLMEHLQAEGRSLMMDLKA